MQNTLDRAATPAAFLAALHDKRQSNRMSGAPLTNFGALEDKPPRVDRRESLQPWGEAKVQLTFTVCSDGEDDPELIIDIETALINGKLQPVGDHFFDHQIEAWKVLLALEVHSDARDAEDEYRIDAFEDARS